MRTMTLRATKTENKEHATDTLSAIMAHSNAEICQKSSHSAKTGRKNSLAHSLLLNR